MVEPYLEFISELHVILVEIVDYHHLLIYVAVPPFGVRLLYVSIRVEFMGCTGLTGSGRSVPPFIIEGT